MNDPNEGAMTVQAEFGIIHAPLLEANQCSRLVEEATGRPGWRTAGDVSLGSRVLSLARDDAFFGAAFAHIEGTSAAVAAAAWRLPPLCLYELSLVRYVRQAEVPLHTDTGPFKPNRIISIVCYLSDGFTGGDLMIPRIGFKGRAAQGSAVLFPSSERHGTSALRGGEKIVLVGFLCAADICWS